MQGIHNFIYMVMNAFIKDSSSCQKLSEKCLTPASVKFLIWRPVELRLVEFCNLTSHLLFDV